jgi:multiple sugar transport system substrate-binding protein
MRWQKTVGLLIVLSLCATLVSCGQETSETNEVTKAATDIVTSSPEAAAGDALTFRITWKAYSGRGEAIQAIVDVYNKQTGEATAVTLIDGDEDRAAIETLLKSDSETVYVLPYRYVKYFGGNGLLLDESELFADVKDLYNEGIWALGGVDGKTYGVPWLGHSMCLLYNKTLLEKAGIQAETLTDMDALIAAFNTIREKTGAGGLGLVGAESNDVSWMVNQFIYGFGSSLVSADGKTVTVNNEKSAAALRLYRDTLGSYAQAGWVDDTATEVTDAFRAQEVAFEILGIWGVTDVAKNGSPFEVGVLPLKTFGLCSEVGPMMLSVPAGISEEGKQAAVRFIRYMISKEAQAAILKGEYDVEHDAYYPFRTPIRIDMADSSYMLDHPEYQTFIEGFGNPSVDVPVPAWQTVKDEVYAPGLHQVMNGELTIEDFLQNVEQKGNEILNRQ